jgi:hypothetical protein
MEKSQIKALDPGVFKVGDAVKIRAKGSAALGGLRSGTIAAVDKDFVYVRAGCDPIITAKFARESASRFIFPAKGKGKRD